MSVETPGERIRRLRQNVMIHSYLYYVLNDTIVTDHQWQAWATELVDLQARWPGSHGLLDDEFAGWDGISGFDFKYPKWMVDHAHYLQRLQHNPGMRGAKPAPVVYTLQGKPLAPAWTVTAPPAAAEAPPSDPAPTKRRAPTRRAAPAVAAPQDPPEQASLF